MTELIRYRVQLPYPHDPNRGPGWSDLWLRENTTDEVVLREVWVEDVYQVRGLDLGPHGDEYLVKNGVGATVDHHYEHAGATVIDLGANIGTFSALCLQYGAEEVIAVEPDPDNLTVLRRNIEPWPTRVTVVRAAVASSARRVTLHGSAGTAYVNDDGEFTTNAVALTDILASINRDITVCKCDIEGGEYETFLACPTDQLARIERIHMEWHGQQMTPWRDSWPIGDLVAHLLPTHNVQVFGDPAVGGMLFAVRYAI